VKVRAHHLSVRPRTSMHYYRRHSPSPHVGRCTPQMFLHTSIPCLDILNPTLQKTSLDLNTPLSALSILPWMAYPATECNSVHRLFSLPHKYSVQSRYMHPMTHTRLLSTLLCGSNNVNPIIELQNLHSSTQSYISESHTSLHDRSVHSSSTASTVTAKPAEAHLTPSRRLSLSSSTLPILTG
jgi:hypothetical protein